MLKAVIVTVIVVKVLKVNLKNFVSKWLHYYLSLIQMVKDKKLEIKVHDSTIVLTHL